MNFLHLQPNYFSWQFLLFISNLIHLALQLGKCTKKVQKNRYKSITYITEPIKHIKYTATNRLRHISTTVKNGWNDTKRNFIWNAFKSNIISNLVNLLSFTHHLCVITSIDLRPGKYTERRKWGNNFYGWPRYSLVSLHQLTNPKAEEIKCWTI